ncbi:MAG TPA: MFS transporter [Planctomycetes bacterium]|nr:MFS transporter [Planctomycetota bacterium]
MNWSREKRREIASWCLFDFANSSFTTVVITVIYARYFTTRVAGDQGHLWSLALAISNAIIIVSGPIVGAVADRHAIKKRLLFASYLACVLCTAGLFLPTRGDWSTAFLLFVVANVAFSTGENLIAAFLPEIARPEEIGKVSGMGWATGYAGGLLALLVCLPLARSGDDLTLRSTNLVVAGFFLLGGIPTFLFVRERSRKPGDASSTAERPSAFAEVRRTWTRRREFPELFRFLTAYLVFSIGVYGVIQFASILAEDFSLSPAETIPPLIAAQVTAAVGAMTVGRGMARFGAVGFIRMSLLMWIACGAVALFARGAVGFWVLAVLAGGALGATMAASRATVALFTPTRRSGEIFGFWGLYGRLAAILAPLGNWALLTVSGGSKRAGVLYFTLSFVLGCLLLRRVDERAGRDRAVKRVT